MSVIATVAAALAVFNTNNIATVSIDAGALQTAAGQEVVYAQLQRSAARACSSSSVLARARIAARTSCRQGLLDDWMAQIDHPGLTALHGGDDLERLAQR